MLRWRKAGTGDVGRRGRRRAAKSRGTMCRTGCSATCPPRPARAARALALDGARACALRSATRARSRAAGSCIACCRRCPRSRRAPRRGGAPASRARAGVQRRRARGDRARGARRSRRCALRAAVRARLARRGADRRHRFTQMNAGSPARSTASPSPPRDVLIADYKSDRLVPRRIEDIPEELCRATGPLSRRCCARLYPNHRVRAALVWTAGPALTELPDAALDAAMSRLAGVRKNTTP